MGRKTKGSAAPVVARRTGTEREKRRQKIAGGLGEIYPDVVYPMDLFQERTGLGDYAIRKAEKRGLKVAIVGNERYVDGSEWLRHVREQAEKAGA